VHGGRFGGVLYVAVRFGVLTFEERAQLQIRAILHYRVALYPALRLTEDGAVKRWVDKGHAKRWERTIENTNLFTSCPDHSAVRVEVDDLDRRFDVPRCRLRW
jgi:hypothetical protein